MPAYYPDQRYLSKLTTIHREVTLPENAIGNVQVQEGARVEVRDKVARGLIPARHIIIDAAAELGLRNRENLSRFMLVKERERIEAQTPIAGKQKNRGKRVFAPFNGFVAGIDNGRIIMQEMPEILSLEAGLRGEVVRVYPGYGVAVEAIGAIVQGVWGNGKRIIATMRMEPSNGLEHLVTDTLEMTYKGAVMVTTRQLKTLGIEVAIDQGLSGIIAPSIDASLIDEALASELVIMITEGFGNMRMGGEVVAIMKEFEGSQITLDAYTPKGWEPRRPEMMINQSAEETPPAPNIMISLRPGMSVRMSRDPYLGQTGRVIELPETPLLLDNGLRVPGARVELITGDKISVPLANLELISGK